MPPQAPSDAERRLQMLEAHAPPSLMVDAEANVVHVFEAANRYLQFASGSPSLNLYRVILPELRLELRRALYQALERAEATISTPIPVEIRGARRLVQLYVTPEGKQRPPMALVVFAETNLPASGIQPVQEAASFEVDPQLHQMEAKPETTQAQLQDTLKAYEAQQEELRTLNEELLSINEEYKATLEELETSKEELQSVNEELITVNGELQEWLKDLRQADHHIQNLIAASDVGLLFVDRQLTIGLYTQPLTQLFNILPIDRGRPLAHVTHRLGDIDIGHAIEQTLETPVSTEREVQRDDGRYYLMRLTPYRTTDNAPEGVVATFMDITERKQAQAILEAQVRARQRLEAQLRQTQKMEALGTLAGGIAHEFNNILAALLGFATLLHHEVPPKSRAGFYVQQVRQAGDRAKELVQQILTFSRAESLEREPLELDQVVQEAMTLLRASLPSTVDIEYHVSEPGVMVQANRTQLHGVMMNLGANADYAMRESGGRLVVRVDLVEVDAAFATAHPPLSPGRHVCLRMDDTGSGIPAEVMGRIFEPF
jgi:two-component system CheB/CheR fusion protein